MASWNRGARPVLIVDDDMDLREALGATLEADGYSVVEAGDGEEALAKLRGGLAPSVILLDLSMPRMSGAAFRAEQVLDASLVALPVVILSGEAGLRETAAALGVEAWAQKPVDMDDVLQMIARWRVH